MNHEFHEQVRPGFESPVALTSLFALAIFVFMGMVAGCQSSEQQPEVESSEGITESVKIVNWNVLYGFNHGKKKQLGAKWISEQQPDVVALQELNGFTLESLTSLAKDETGWRHPHAVILKEKGFPVGLTSNQPIEVLKKQVDGFHHGYVHAKTHGIHFFVVHFWPGKDHEGAQIAREIEDLLDLDEQVVLLGDFNTHSRRDSGDLVLRSKVKPQYNVVDLFEKTGMVDLVHRHSPNQKYSCPSPVTIPKWSEDLEELKSKRQRIDFIFTDTRLAEQSTGASIRYESPVEEVSDHYPVVAVLEFQKSGKR